MGSGSPSFLLAGGPTGAAVLAADIGSLIQNPAVLLGAAAVVVVAVLIVLIMVLRGGSRKADLAQEVEEEQGAWESAPRGVPSQVSRGRDSRDQMLPWEQGGARAESGRPSMSSRRGPGGRDAQAGWGQPDQDAPPWESQGQPAPRGGQWVGTDEWVPPEAAMGRGNVDQRGQGQMGARENEGWPWSANQAPAGGQNADQWGQGAGAPMGRGDDQWGQAPANSRPRGRENDQWGQGAGAPYASGRGDDQWGQAPASGPAPMGRGNDQWGQAPAPAPAMGRGDDQWGQGAAMAGRGQDQWGAPPAPNGYNAGQAADQGFDQRGGPRRGAEPAGQADGQWGQGNWGQANDGWNSGEPAGQWGQAPASPPPAARPASPGTSRPNSQSGPAGMGNQPPSPDAGGGWGERDAAAWQAEPRRDQPSWQTPSWQSPEPEPAGPRSGPRNQAPAQPQWDEPGRGDAPPAWGAAAAPADQWAQPEPAPRMNPSRPIDPAGARGTSQPMASGGEWGDYGSERPTVRQTPQPASWEQQGAPAWQTPSPQMAAPAGAADAPTARPGAAAGRLGKANPDATAYAPPPPDSESGVDKTIVIRKDAGAGRAPSVVVRQGKEPGRSYDMRKDHITIGRSRDSDIFLEDLAVSRLHATIYRDEMGGYLLRDENSANGTSVNGQRVSEVTLQEGDEIQLGQTILAFVRR